MEVGENDEPRAVWGGEERNVLAKLALSSFNGSFQENKVCGYIFVLKCTHFGMVTPGNQTTIYYLLNKTIWL